MFSLLKPGPGSLYDSLTPCGPVQSLIAAVLTCLLRAVLKTDKNGADNLLASHGLSKIYEFLLVRGHDTYLKGLPDDVTLYK